MSQSSKAKALRREINKHAEKIETNVALDIIEGLYRMPLLKRIKWAMKIAYGTGRDYDYCALVWVYRADRFIERMLEVLGRDIFVKKVSDENVKK